MENLVILDTQIQIGLKQKKKLTIKKMTQKQLAMVKMKSMYVLIYKIFKSNKLIIIIF
jgi:hypothetical protein